METEEAMEVMPYLATLAIYKEPQETLCSKLTQVVGGSSRKFLGRASIEQAQIWVSRETCSTKT